MKEIKSSKLIEKYMEVYDLAGIFEQETLDHIKLFQYEKGQYLCQNGRNIDFMLFLVKGEVKVFTSLTNGKSYLLRVEKPLSVLGDVEFLDRQEFSANVEALNTCHCLSISFSYLRKMEGHNPIFLRFIIKELGYKLKTISYLSTENLYLPLISKFAAYVLMHVDEGETRVKLKSDFKDISIQLGATYRHLSRVMNRLVEEKILEKDGHSFTVLDRQALVDLAENTTGNMDKY